MKNREVSQGLAHAIVHCAVWALALSAYGAEIEVRVESGEEALKDRSELMALGTTDTLIKTGAGKLLITTELSAKGFTGNIIVRAGVIRLNADKATGTGTFTVEDGGAVELGPDKNSNGLRAINATLVEMAGSGTGSSGAAFANGSNQQSYFVSDSKQTVRLLDDTMFKCVAAGYGPASGTVDLNGKKLILDSGVFECRGAVLKGPGEFVLQNGNKLYLENNTLIFASGTAEDTKVTVKDGCGLQIGGNKIADIDLTKCPRWAVDFENAGSWYVQSWSAGAVFGWNGPVTLGGTVTFGDNANVVTNFLAGAITGAGGIYKQGSATLVLTNLNSCFTGLTTVHAGKLVSAAPLGGDAKLDSIGSVLEAPGVAGALTVTLGTAEIAGAVGGDVTVSSGSAKVAGNVGGKVAVSGGTVQVGVPAGGITGTAGWAKVDLSGGAVTDDILYGYWRSYTDDSTTELDSDTFFDFGVQTPDPYVFSKALDNVIVSHAGEGTLTITSAMSGAPAFKNYGGELVLAPTAPQEIGWADVKGGTMTIAAGSVVKHPTNNITVTASYPAVARLRIRGTLTTEDYRMGISPHRNAVRNADNPRGIVEVFDGAVVTNIFAPNGDLGYVRRKSLGRLTNYMSAYYQHGGEVSLIGDDIAGTGTHYFPAVDQNFYYSLEGGEYSHRDCRDVRFSTKDGTYGLFAQSGGTNVMQRNAGMYIGAGDGYAGYYMSGGRIEGQYATITTCKENWEKAYPFGGCRSFLTFDGPDTVANLPVYDNENSICLCMQINALGEVNVNDGATLAVNCIAKAVSGNLTSGGEKGRFTNSIVRVNFDGGILRMNTNRATGENNVIFSNLVSGVDHVRLYAGGVTIDTEPTSTRQRYVRAALEAPTGNGVSAIALSSEMQALDAWDFIGAPQVEIVDPSGVGTGATAVAIFDTTLGKVTGIRVMNRGVDYPADGVIARVSKGGSTKTFELPCTVTPNVSGGLTKKGAGRLILDRPCTYTGRTILAGGELRLGCDEAIRAESRFVLAGGTLDMNGKTLSDGSTAVTDWGVDVAFARENGVGAYTDLAFPAGSTLTVEGADTLPAEGEDDELKRVNILKVSGSLVDCPELTFAQPVTKGWHVRWVGQTLRASRDIGAMLIVR